MKDDQSPETEIMWICRNLHGKTREITFGEFIFGGFSTFGTAVWWQHQTHGHYAKTPTKEADRKKNLQGSLPRPGMKVMDAAALAYSEGHDPEWRRSPWNWTLSFNWPSLNSDNTIKVILLNEMTSLSHKLLSCFHLFLSEFVMILFMFWTIFYMNFLISLPRDLWSKLTE